MAVYSVMAAYSPWDLVRGGYSTAISAQPMYVRSADRTERAHVHECHLLYVNEQVVEAY